MPAAKDSPRLVTTARELTSNGVGPVERDGEVREGRWQRAGLALVQHNGPLSPDQRRKVALIHAGPQTILTAFSAAEVLGLSGWERATTHVLAPAGTRLRGGCPVPVRLHLAGSEPRRHHGQAIQVLPDAVLRAAATFAVVRPACGILAAAVQQRLVTAEELRQSLALHTRTRHRAALRAAVEDIAGGAQALSEIDFVRLCRRHGLAEPIQQLVRTDNEGRRRYFDATWRRADGKLIVAEVDGALHLIVRRWWDDQFRQNELAISEAMVLRFPSVAVRAEEDAVIDQLRRALAPPAERRNRSCA